MPIVIFVVMSLILLSMGIHDVCVINIVVDRALENTMLTINDNYDIKNDQLRCSEDTGYRLICNTYKKMTGNYEEEVPAIRDYIKDELNESLMIYENKDIKVHIKGGKIKVSITARNIFEKFPYIRNIKKEVTVEEEKIILDESEIARLTQCMEKKHSEGKD